MKYYVLIIAIIGFHCFSMEEGREHSNSFIIIENQPLAYQLIHTILNGHTDEKIIQLIDKNIKKNKAGILYPDLPEKRAMIVNLQQLQFNTQEAKDMLTLYVLQELADQQARSEQQKHKERKQKYIVAGIGILSTLIGSITAVLTTYFSNK